MLRSLSLSWTKHFTSLKQYASIILHYEYFHEVFFFRSKKHLRNSGAGVCIYIILFLFWKWFWKGDKLIPQAFHLKFTSFVRVHGQFSRTIVKSTQSAVIPIYDAWIRGIFIAVFDCMGTFTLQFAFEGVLQGRTLQTGKFSSLSHRNCQPFLREQR